MAVGLARVTVSTPRRRVDVALPEQVPLAELLPEVLRHAGEGLADDGEQHGGWLLRRADGTVLAGGQALAAQGVRDGAVLHLVPARTEWPEFEYDDVVEALADAAASGAGGGHPVPPGRRHSPVPVFRSVSSGDRWWAREPDRPPSAAWCSSRPVRPLSCCVR